MFSIDIGLAVVLTYGMERTIKFYRTVNDNCPVLEFIDSLDDRPAAKVAAVFKMMETLPRVPIKFFKKPSGHEIWECIVEYEGMAYRFLGFLEKRIRGFINARFREKSPEDA